MPSTTSICGNDFYQANDPISACHFLGSDTVYMHACMLVKNKALQTYSLHTQPYCYNIVTRFFIIIIIIILFYFIILIVRKLRDLNPKCFYWKHQEIPTSWVIRFLIQAIRLKSRMEPGFEHRGQSMNQKNFKWHGLLKKKKKSW